MIISVDPGVHHHGCALWKDGELTKAWLSNKNQDNITHELPVFGCKVTVLVIEIPQIYSITRSRGGLKGQNDLIDLSVEAGAVIGSLRHNAVLEVVKYRPREWKGQVPKDIMINRIQRAVSPGELAEVELPRRKDLQHNVWDGIGIGLKYWGRL